jgi:flagellar basal-body rod protein FlgF
MDRLIYVAMNGASHVANQQALVAHNLANSQTNGFRAEQNAFRALPVVGPGAKTRVFSVDSTTGWNFQPGFIQNTGRDLDVAVNGKGWIAVQGVDGKEAYTRDGNFQLSPGGLLQTRSGLNVLGESGPITVPPNNSVAIAPDGTVSAIPQEGVPNNVAVVGRVKLVNPPEVNLQKSLDGLFRTSDGRPMAADVTVQLATGALEGSNVSVVEALTSMISLSRQFDMQIKMLQTAENNSRQASQIINMSG